MKILIAGAGKIGYSIVNKLASEGHDIVVIEQIAAKADNVTNNADVLVIRGNAAIPETLLLAGADKADVFIAATGNDEVNLVSCRFVSEMGTAHTAALIRNPEYMTKVEHIRSAMGISLIINPDLVTAEEISRVIRFPAAIQVDSFPGCSFEIVTFRVPEGSRLNGLRLNEMEKQFGQKLLVPCVVRDDEVMIPDGSFTVRAGDEVSMTGSPEALRKVSDSDGKRRKAVRNAMLLGGSRIAVHLARILESVGIDVIIIERDHARCLYLSETLPMADIIFGNGSDTEVLEENGLGTADAFVTLTSFDEDNIIMAIYAHRYGVPKVVTKVNNERFNELIRNFFPDTSMSPSRLVTERILGFVRGLEYVSDRSTIEAVYYLADQRAQATEFAVGPQASCLGIPLKDIHFRSGVLITALVRNGISYLPDGNTILKAGDRIVAVSKDSNIIDLDDLLAYGAKVR
jgi:trk system potassium uptake protein TrkA